jgi:hypothetical protein
VEFWEYARHDSIMAGMFWIKVLWRTPFVLWGQGLKSWTVLTVSALYNVIIYLIIVIFQDCKLTKQLPELRNCSVLPH